ncbi:hypothetical protein HPT27_00355 [Permianibacter sp. IMCC34836]|uniref:hypothetical protein n=1 Tax=Permianibacter fluminis TaxID=2738515 RepID=UPI0015543E11|nr:hypothetical protein [Permianibacter fluminis]NQD35452.1 hypothetical protein [Permianibacter fluminis]
MTSATYNPADLDRLQNLAERYARYSRSAGGLSSVLGGLLCLIMFGTALVFELSQPVRVALAIAPLLWLLSKELLRRYYYQRAGMVLEKLSPGQWRLHVGLTAFVALVSLGILGLGLYKFGVPGLLALPWQQLGYFVFVIAMPVVVWRWLWSSSDFIIGVNVMCQAALIIAGRHYELDALGLYMLGAGALSIWLGIREHRDYLQLRRELAQQLTQTRTLHHAADTAA